MPELSVILNTARSGHAMIGLKDQHHFFYTIGALARQSHRDFELIVSDYIYDRRKYDFSQIPNVFFPIYHMPITHSHAKDNNYVAICAGKNNGIFYAEGTYLLFLDDCCSFPSDFLYSVLDIMKYEHTFPNALHVKQKGSDNYRDINGNPIRDCRYVLFDHYKSDKIVDNFHMYGYSSMTLEAALKLNGFDECYDYSRQLEDIDMGERLKYAGYHISLHKRLFVAEQEHLQLGPQPVGKPGDVQANCGIEDEITFRPHLKCNGPILWLKNDRLGADKWLANHRPWSAEEKAKIKPCHLLAGEMCRASNMSCNFLGETKHMALPEADWLLNNPPVFNLTQIRGQRLAAKEKYRVR